MKSKRIVYIFILIAFLLNIYQLLLGYISLILAIRFSIIFLIVLAINLFINNTGRFYYRIINVISSFLILISISYNIQYFYKVDLVVVIVPKNYSGKVNIKMNDSKSSNFIKPLNRILKIELDRYGNFSTKSKYKIEFNSVIAVEEENMNMQNKRFELNDKKARNLINIGGDNIYIFTATLERK